MHKVYLEELITQQESMPSFTRKRLEAHQLQTLNMQLQRAKALSPFYADYPDRLESLEDLKTLPFTTSEQLIENFPKLCLVPAEEITRVRTEYTSGTEGLPKKVAYSDYDTNRTIDFFENGLQELIYPGNAVLICFPYTDSLSLGGIIAEAVRRICAVPLCPGHDKTYGEYLDIIAKNNVSVYLGPPVLLLSLLRLQPETTLKRALVSGDRCSEAVIRECEKLLGSKLFPHYGLRESGLGCAYTCCAHAGMHIRENDIICEIVDASGKPLPDDEWGELVITTIGMDAMPLFRYKTNDFAKLVGGKCPCGSYIKRLEVAGRMGPSVGIGYYDEILFAFDEIIDFSIKGNSAIISVINNSGSLEPAVQRLLRGFDIEFISAQLTQKPMYTGKRRIL